MAPPARCRDLHRGNGHSRALAGRPRPRRWGSARSGAVGADPSHGHGGQRRMLPPALRRDAPLPFHGGFRGLAPVTAPFPGSSPDVRAGNLIAGSLGASARAELSQADVDATAWSFPTRTMAGGEESQGRGRRISSLPTFGRGAAFHHPPASTTPAPRPKGGSEAIRRPRTGSEGDSP